MDYGTSTLNNSMKIRSTNKSFFKGPILDSEIITKINIKYIECYVKKIQLGNSCIRKLFSICNKKNFSLVQSLVH